MKYGIKLMLSIILILISFSTEIHGNNLPFRVGETLNYSVKFNFIPAGTAALKVVSADTVNNIPSFHIQYSARTGSLADRLFKIRDNEMLHPMQQQQKLLSSKEQSPCMLSRQMQT